jgi:sugar-specific transcriptional regulator TrmB
MSTRRNPTELLDVLDLTEYGAQALHTLIEVGRTTAPDLSEATGIPKARIYEVLDTLADQGYIKIIPGRPKQYEPKHPRTILERAIENERQSFETYRMRVEEIEDDFLDVFEPLYAQNQDAVSPVEELFYVVDVGDPSERETRTMYHEARERIHILTKSFEYFEAIEPAVTAAIERDIEMRVIVLESALLTDTNEAIQTEILEYLEHSYPEIEKRASAKRLPWRGTVVDPSMEYDTGQAVLLVEEEEIPLHKRQAAVTTNGSFVAGLERYFDLIWRYDTTEVEV